jgi:hypothetical protein
MFASNDYLIYSLIFPFFNHVSISVYSPAGREGREVRLASINLCS